MKPEPLSPVKAFEIIQSMLDLGPDVISFARHARDRSDERNFNRRDVEKVLRHGAVGASPEWNELFQNWKYRVSGADVDGDTLS